MNTLEIQSLNKEITNERISMPYPHVNVLEPSDAIALVVPSLPKGDLPVICEFHGTRRQIGSIRNSALVLESLRKVSSIEYVKAPNVKAAIKTSLDAVEVLV